MQFKLNTLASPLKAALCAAMAMGFAASIQAADNPANGTWTWTVQGRNGNERTMTLKLQTVDGKLTGKLGTPGRNGRVREVEIKDATLKGDELTFKVVREFRGNSFTTTYKAKISGDKITGKTEVEGRNGQTRSRKWEAKRKTETT